MLKYILKRIGLAFVTIIIILSLSFVLMKLLPFEKPVGTSDVRASYYATQIHLGYLVDFTEPTSGYGEPIDMIVNYKGETVYYYQVPIMEQYFTWAKNIITKWEWGTSSAIGINLNATFIIAQRLPTTVKINIVATLIAVPIGIGLGILSALKKNSKFDNTTQTVVMLFISVPSFVLISVLILTLGYKTDLLPTQWPSETAPLQTRILGYVIPVLALSFGSIAGYTRFVRAELCEVMSSEYLLLARTKGLTRGQAINRHALKNAMVPIFPAILAEFIAVLGGSMILENLYGINGIGNLFIEAINKKDYNVLFVDMAIFTTIGLLSGVVLDISYGFIDPRIRMGAKK